MSFIIGVLFGIFVTLLGQKMLRDLDKFMDEEDFY